MRKKPPVFKGKSFKNASVKDMPKWGKAGALDIERNPQVNIGAQRQLTVRVKTARGRKPSSTRWLERQLNDPYVYEANRLGYRSRAAFKLIEIDDKFKILKRGQSVVDLGCAPGGWLQVCAQRLGAKGTVLGIDLQDIEPIAGLTILVGDMREPQHQQTIIDHCPGGADVVLSDMAAAATGHANTDHIRIMDLVAIALDTAESVLRPGGAFVAKVLAGGAQGALMTRIKQDFKKVHHFKPPSSRADSREEFLVALGWRGSGGNKLE